MKFRSRLLVLLISLHIVAVIAVSFLMGSELPKRGFKREFFSSAEKSAFAFAQSHHREFDLLTAYLDFFGLAQDWRLFAPNPNYRIDEAAVFSSGNDLMCEGDLSRLIPIRIYRFSDFQFHTPTPLSGDRDFKLISRLADSLRNGNSKMAKLFSEGWRNRIEHGKFSEANLYLVIYTHELIRDAKRVSGIKTKVTAYGPYNHEN